MTLDSRIRSLLDQEASTVEAPWPPPLDDLVLAGEQELRRRRGRRRVVGGVLAAALVVAAGVILSTNGPDGTSDGAPVARPSRLRLAELPAGPRPESLYCVDGVVGHGAETLRLGSGDCSWPSRFAESGSSAAVVDRTRPTVTLFTAGGRQELAVLADNEASPVVFGPDGDEVAWVSRDRVDGREEIVLWDTVRGAERGRVRAPTRDVLNLEGIDGSGRVYMTSTGSDGRIADRVWVWASRTDERFRRVVGLGDFLTVADVPPDGLVVLKTLYENRGPVGDATAVGRAAWGTVTGRGEFVLGSETEVRPVVWSPDRSRYATVESVRVVSRTGEGSGPADVEVRLPSDVTVAGSPSWESAEQLLVPVTHTSTGRVAILRCSAGTGRCEVAATGRHDVALPGGDADNLG